MQFTILRETPVNSGTYVATGEVINTSADTAIQHALDLATANGTRYAIEPYDPLARPAASTSLAGPPVVYSPADASAIVTPNVAVQVFLPGSVTNGADIFNTGSQTLYIDPTGNVAVAGSSTAIPVRPGQGFHFSRAPIGGVSAVANAAQSFVAIRR